MALLVGWVAYAVRRPGGVRRWVVNRSHSILRRWPLHLAGTGLGPQSRCTRPEVSLLSGRLQAYADMSKMSMRGVVFVGVLCLLAVLGLNHLFRSYRVRQANLPIQATPAPFHGAPTPSNASVATAAVPEAVLPVPVVGHVDASKSRPVPPVGKVGPPVADPVKTVIGEGRDGSYRGRVAAVHRLGNRLPRPEVEALYEFLERKLETQGELTLLEFNAVKNDALEKLLEQDALPEDLGHEMVNMYRDRALDPVWRAYCVQHFFAYYEKKWPAGRTAAEADAEREALMKAYGEAVAETDGNIAGTALIGMSTLSESHPEIDRNAVAGKALAIATDGKAGVESRITAVQICATMGRTEVLLTARGLAEQGAVVPLRLSAIAALGQVGTAEDGAVLSRVAAGKEPYTRRAAEKALANLRRRLQTQPQ